MATIDSELQNLNTISNDIRELAEKLDPRAMGLNDLLESVRSSERNDNNIRIALERSFQNESQTTNILRGLNSLMQDSINSQNKILEEIKTLSSNIESAFSSQQFTDNSNMVNSNRSRQKNKKGNVFSNFLKGGAAALGALGMGFLGSTALQGPANAQQAVSSPRSQQSQSSNYRPSTGSDAVTTTSPVTSTGSVSSGGNLQQGALLGGAKMPSNISPEVLKSVNETAKNIGVDPAALSMMIDMESGWDPNATGSGGKYRGMTQIGAETFRDPGAVGGRIAGKSYSDYLSSSPADQIRFYEDWLKHYKFKDKLDKYGIDLSQYSPAVQAAFLQAMQFSPGATSWMKDFAQGNYNNPVTRTHQASALNPAQSGWNPSIASMSQYYGKTLKANPAVYQPAPTQQTTSQPLTSNLEMPQGQTSPIEQTPIESVPAPSSSSSGPAPNVNNIELTPTSPTLAPSATGTMQEFTGSLGELTPDSRDIINRAIKFGKLSGIPEEAIELLKHSRNPEDFKKYFESLSKEEKDKLSEQLTAGKDSPILRNVLENHEDLNKVYGNAINLLSGNNTPTQGEQIQVPTTTNEPVETTDPDTTTPGVESNTEEEPSEIKFESQVPDLPDDIEDRFISPVSRNLSPNVLSPNNMLASVGQQQLQADLVPNLPILNPETIQPAIVIEPEPVPSNEPTESRRADPREVTPADKKPGFSNIKFAELIRDVIPPTIPNHNYGYDPNQNSKTTV